MYPKELIKGSLQTIILKLLSDGEKMYGYQITQEIKKLTAGKITITEAAIYPILHKLKAEGELSTEKVSVGERVRIYYPLPEKGKGESFEEAYQVAMGSFGERELPQVQQKTAALLDGSKVFYPGIRQSLDMLLFFFLLYFFGRFAYPTTDESMTRM